MKSNLRLNSAVPHGMGSTPETGAISLIYEFLLEESEQGFYRHITINQIGEDLDEFIEKEASNDIHINIRYPAFENLAKLETSQKNHMRLDLIHTGLVKIADFDKKLDIV